MQIKSLRYGIAISCGLILSTNAFAQDFCSTTTSHSGEKYTTTKSYDKGEFKNGIGYEIWYDGGNNSATFYNDGSFSCSFSNTKDYLCRTGLSFNSTQTYKQIGQMYADFKLVKQNVSNVGYSYVGVYGWMSNPLVEFYIVDNWLSQYRPGDWVGDKKLGTYKIDGADYDVYTNTRYNAPSIEGDKTFTQYFSIRKTARDCGRIDINAHFKKWEELGLGMGVMYEAKILGEAGNTSGGATGTADFPYAKVYIATSSSSSSSSPSSSSSSSISSSSSSSITRTPYSSNALPGKVEAENFDNGNSLVTYKDSDTKDEGATGYRTGYPVDVVGVGSGYGVGYVNPGEWLEYTVNVAKAGNYNVTVRAANGTDAARSITFLVDGKAWSSVSVPNEVDGWNSYVEATSKSPAALTAGKHVVRMSFEEGYTNIDWFEFTEVVPPESSSSEESSSSIASSSSVVSSSSEELSSSSEISSSSEAVSSSSEAESSSSSSEEESSSSTEGFSSSSTPIEDPSSSSEEESSSSVEESSSSEEAESSSSEMASSSSSEESSSSEVSSSSLASSSSVVSSSSEELSSSSEISSSSETISSSSEVTSSSSTIPESSSSSQEIISSSSSSKHEVESSSSSFEGFSSSSLEDSSSSEESSSSSEELESSSSIEVVESSSSEQAIESSSSVEVDPNAIAKINMLNSSQALLVFDLQGRFLGSVRLQGNSSLNETLKKHFNKAGVYLVKQGNRMQRVNVK